MLLDYFLSLLAGHSVKMCHNEGFSGKRNAHLHQIYELCKQNSDFVSAKRINFSLYENLNVSSYVARRLQACYGHILADHFNQTLSQLLLQRFSQAICSMITCMYKSHHCL